MIRRYTFMADEKGRLEFWYCFIAYVRRGDPQQGTRQSKTDHRSEAKIGRALFAISEPVEGAVPPLPGLPDTRMRKLLATGGTLSLEQPEFKRLQDYMESAQWDASLTPTLVDIQDALDAAEKVES